MTEQQDTPKIYLKETTAIQRIEKVLDQLTPRSADRVLSFVVDAANERQRAHLGAELENLNNRPRDPGQAIGASRFA